MSDEQANGAPRAGDLIDAAPVGFLVAIGAPAEGLDSLRRFFGEIPRRSGAAYVVVQHLSPSSKGLVGEQLAGHTEMNVIRAVDGMAIERDCVHLLPPGMAPTMTVGEGRLHLSERPRTSSVPQLPIDSFFRSVADEFGACGIGVVMPGTGSDGLCGSESIREAGGLTLVQDDAATTSGDAPKRSIDAGTAERVMSPEETAAAVLARLRDQVGVRPDTQQGRLIADQYKTQSPATIQELLASNLELRSANEELRAVNSEHQRRIAEITKLTNDADNLLSNADVAVVFLDSALLVRRLTPAACVHFGLGNLDVGRPLSELTHALSNVPLCADLRRVLESGAMIQRTVRSLSGADLLLRFLPYRSPAGVVDGVMLMIVDTSLVAEARRELDSMMARFEAFMHHSPAMKWALDEDGRFIFINPTYARLMGVDREGALGRAPREVLQERTSEAFLRRSQETSTEAFKGDPIHFDIEVPVGDKRYDFFVSKFVFDDADGRKVLGGSAIDITELKRITSERDEVRGRLELAMNGAGCGLWDWNVETGEATVDPSYFTMLGYEPDAFEMSFARWKELVHPEDLPGALARIEAYFAGQAENYRAPYRMARADGGYRWIVAVGEATERRDDGSPIRLTGINLDIDDLKQAELALEELNDELVENNQSLASRNHELDQFAHAASHDLRSPLRTVIGFAEIVEESLANNQVDEARDALSRIEGAALRMSGLIDSLLLFASVGRSEINEEAVSLNSIVAQVKADLKPEIEEAGGRIVADASLPKLLGDATMLRQVFQNLISNAFKYRSTARDPVATIEAELAEDFVIIYVRDNGLGFDQKDADRAFAPFQRLHAGESARGSGIGLSICRRVVERHGGTIDVETAVGVGSTFRIAFPIGRIASSSVR